MVRLFLAERSRSKHELLPATIVNIGTPGALIPLDAIPLYCATKAALHMFTRVLRRQLRDTPVTVIEVLPPSLDTALTRDLNVAGQTANGVDVIAEVAAEIVSGVREGRETILPHPQCRALYASVPQLDPGFVDELNSGVVRKAGWNEVRERRLECACIREITTLSKIWIINMIKI